jgi:hypothetical protein
MSEETVNEVDGDVAPEESRSILDQNIGVDWHLAHLIYETDIFGLEPGITLSVGGMLVTGKLISGRKYFELVEATYAAAAEKQPNASQRDTLHAIASRYGQFQDVYTFPDDHPLDAHRPNFIHLMDVKFYLQSGNPMPSNGTLWRGKLTSVDGVTHGTLDPA